MSEPERDTLLRFFKALADESRLKIIGLLAERRRSVDELADALGLKPPTVSHHLARLKEAGLVRMRADGNVHHYSLETGALKEMSRDILTPLRTSVAIEDLPADPAEAKVVRGYLEHGRLKTIPSGHRKRGIILRWLAERFEPDRDYPEKEVNEILGRYHDDVEFFRRSMIDFGLFERNRSIYRRV
jgi:DNA-binding transcriptional ArsR family regulator